MGGGGIMSDENDKFKYLNTPMVLYKGFMEDFQKVMYNVGCFAAYSKGTHISASGKIDEFGGFKLGASHFGLKFIHFEDAYFNGEKLFKKYENESLPYTGISYKTFQEFFFNPKTELQKIELLAFLALKSIQGNKSKVLCSDRFMFGRMDGNSKSIEFPEELESEIIASYWTRRKRDRIINDLQKDWNMKYYSRYMKGFYFSFSDKVTLYDLALYAEERKLGNLERKNSKMQNEARRMALEKVHKVHHY